MNKKDNWPHDETIILCYKKTTDGLKTHQMETNLFKKH